jgi:hypothetical protein
LSNLLINFESHITPVEVSTRGGMGLVRKSPAKRSSARGGLNKGGHGKRIVSYEAASGGPIAPLFKRNGVISQKISCLIGRRLLVLPMNKPNLIFQLYRGQFG